LGATAAGRPARPSSTNRPSASNRVRRSDRPPNKDVNVFVVLARTNPERWVALTAVSIGRHPPRTSW
jgi:hypothetical protein